MFGSDGKALGEREGYGMLVYILIKAAMQEHCTDTICFHMIVNRTGN
jgi:hypothetical protein